MSRPSRGVINEHVESGGWTQPALSGKPWSVHERLPGYTHTPLHSLKSIARENGLAQILAKDERERFGLPAFKVIGASWAVVRLLEWEFARRGRELEPWRDVTELVERASMLGTRLLVTATDGNHGRGVARVARWLGWEAKVFMPRGTVDSRIAAIENEDAAVSIVDGPYDDAVEAAKRVAESADGWLIQDTSWPGYEEIPNWIVEGYETILREIDQELDARRDDWPDVIFVPFGVGALAGTVIRHHRHSGSEHPKIVTVEPLEAACALESLHARRLVSVTGSARTIMAGLNCGTVGLNILEPLLRGVDAAIAIDDEWAIRALRSLHQSGYRTGESGASSLAGLLALMQDPALNNVREHLEITSGSRALVFLTEGVTDPEGYNQLVQA